jgi:SAM-dependent methyltransferase
MTMMLVVQNKVDSLLDYGCAEGALTAMLKDSLAVPKENVFGADVRAIPARGFQFVQIASEDPMTDLSPALGTILPALSGNSVQMVTTSMVFHHVTYIEAAVLELHRVVRKLDGFLVLREHDCDHRATAVFLDIIHGLYSLAWSTPVEMPDFLENYRAFYRSREGWDQLLAGYGFQPYRPRSSNQEFLYNSASRSRAKADGSIPNVARGYHAVYRPTTDFRTMRATNMSNQPTSTLTTLRNNNKHRTPDGHPKQQQQQQQQQVIADEDMVDTVLESRSQPGRLFRFNRRTGTSQWMD